MKIFIVCMVMLTLFNGGCSFGKQQALSNGSNKAANESLNINKNLIGDRNFSGQEEDTTESIPERGIFKHDCRFKKLYNDLKDPIEMALIQGNAYDPWLEHYSLDVVRNVKAVCVNQQGFSGATYLIKDYKNYVIVKILVSSWANSSGDCLIEIIYKKIPRSKSEYVKKNHIYVVDTGFGNILFHPVMVSSPNSNFFDEALWVCNGEDGFLKLKKDEYKQYI
ncbi:hypothetical protein [Phascolarctobacterium faecium]|uniref:hypothetical protein n=1 Tax=Phascolarctobacterium faecium TaxID=33025 RepID=UPI00300F3708